MADDTSPGTRQDILDRVEKRASAYYYEFSGCAQMVILAVQQEFKLPGGQSVFKAATYGARATSGFGGLCGAFVGGLLAMGMASGRERIEDSIYPEPEVRNEATGFTKSLERIRKYNQAFLAEFSSRQCLELQAKMLGRSYNPEIYEESIKYSSAGGREKCSALVGKAARLAAEAVLDMPRR